MNKRKICLILSIFIFMLQLNTYANDTDIGDDIINVRLPYDISFKIVLLENTKQGWISSQDFEIENLGLKDVIVKFTAIYYTFKNDENFISVDNEDEIQYITDKKAVYMQMNCDGIVSQDNYIIKDYAQDNSIEFLLKGKNSENYDNTANFNFSGAVNPMSEIPWEEKDISINIEYVIYNADKEELLQESTVILENIDETTQSTTETTSLLTQNADELNQEYTAASSAAIEICTDSAIETTTLSESETNEEASETTTEEASETTTANNESDSSADNLIYSSNSTGSGSSGKNSASVSSSAIEISDTDEETDSSEKTENNNSEDVNQTDASDNLSSSSALDAEYSEDDDVSGSSDNSTENINDDLSSSTAVNAEITDECVSSGASVNAISSEENSQNNNIDENISIDIVEAETDSSKKFIS